MGLLGRIRFLFGHCPICGGNLKCISHDCIKGDTYKCMWCGKIWIEE